MGLMGGNVKAHDTIVAIYDDTPTERENDSTKWHHLWIWMSYTTAIEVVYDAQHLKHNIARREKYFFFIHLLETKPLLRYANKVGTV